MRNILRFLGCSASLMAMLAIGGGHWAVLQTVAWAQMAVDYTHDSGSLRQGLAETFDGAHPCELCRQISAGIKKESRDDRQQTLRKDLLRKITLAPVPMAAFSPPTVRPRRPLSPRVNLLDGRWAETPPVPPPRRA